MENSTINPVPPNVADLAWRTVSRDELSALIDLATACYLTDGGLTGINEPEAVMSFYFPDGLGAAIGAFTTDDRLAACATVHLTRKSDAALTIIVGQVHPERRNQGIGTYLMRWSEVQAQTLFSATLGDERVLQIATENLTKPAEHLYDKHGFAPVFESLVMQRNLHRPLPDCPLPTGVTLSSWQPDLAGQFFQAYHTAFRHRPGFPDWRAAEWIARVTSNDHKPEWSLLACADDVPLGFVIGNLVLVTNPPDGEVWQVGVVPEHRRRGLGSALLVQALQRMRVDGATLAQLTVNVNNPGAIQTYAQLGFITVGRRARYERIIETISR